MQNLGPEYHIAIISASAAILGAIIGAGVSIVSPWFSKKVNESGKNEVYCRFVFSESDQREFGIYHSSRLNDYYLMVPMWIEIANKAVSPKYIRDFNIVAYNKKDKICDFTQIQRVEIGESKKIEFGNHQSYSFVIDGKSVARYNAEFILRKSEIKSADKTFNILKARYYNENGKLIESTIFESNHPIEWKEGTLEYNKEWVSVNRR